MVEFATVSLKRLYFPTPQYRTPSVLWMFSSLLKLILFNRNYPRNGYIEISRDNIHKKEDGSAIKIPASDPKHVTIRANETYCNFANLTRMSPQRLE